MQIIEQEEHDEVVFIGIHGEPATPRTIASIRMTNGSFLTMNTTRRNSDDLHNENKASEENTGLSENKVMTDGARKSESIEEKSLPSKILQTNIINQSTQKEQFFEDDDDTDSSGTFLQHCYLTASLFALLKFAAKQIVFV